MMHALGKHLLVELYECSPDRLNDVTRIEQSMVRAAREAGATVINTSFHHFSPYGVSGVVVIQESHLSIHTWPEHGFAAVDIFTCGDSLDPDVACTLLRASLQATRASTREVHRGRIDRLGEGKTDPRLPVSARLHPPHLPETSGSPSETTISPSPSGTPASFSSSNLPVRK